MPQSFRDLLVWRKALQMTTVVYRFTQAFPAKKSTAWPPGCDVLQYQFPATSLKAMEESQKANTNSFPGSLAAQISNYKRRWKIARALGYGDPKLLEDAEALSHEVGKMIFGLLESVTRTSPIH